MSKIKFSFKKVIVYLSFLMIMALTNSADKPYLNGNFLMDLFAQSVAIRLIAL